MSLSYYSGGIFFIETLWNVFMDASQPLSNLIIHCFASLEFIEGRNLKPGL